MVPIPRSDTAAVPLPRIVGAMYAWTSSTRPARRNALVTVAPPSTSTVRHSRSHAFASPTLGSREATRSALASRQTLAPAVSRSPTTMRRGWCGSATPVGRALSSGSSIETVPVPTMIASTSARTRCACSRASSPVIQKLVPSTAAVRPSSVEAHFAITYGRCRAMATSQRRLSARAPSCGTNSTSTPRPAR